MKPAASKILFLLVNYKSLPKQLAVKIYFTQLVKGWKRKNKTKQNKTPKQLVVEFKFTQLVIGQNKKKE